MSPKLPVVTGKELARVVVKLGFGFRRQKGSHAIYVHPLNKTRVVIPMHAGAAIKPKTLRGIIQDLKVTVEEFAALL